MKTKLKLSGRKVTIAIPTIEQNGEATYRDMLHAVTETSQKNLENSGALFTTDVNPDMLWEAYLVGFGRDGNGRRRKKRWLT